MPGTAGELPLADVGGAQLRTGQPNPVTGRSDMTVLELANDTVAFAVALKGDAYPRVMLQPTKGLLAGGGTAQPSATLVPVVSPLEGVPIFAYGDSYLTNFGNTSKQYIDRIVSRLGLGSLTDRGVNGYYMQDAANLALGPGASVWTPGTRSIVIIDATTNDAGYTGASARDLAAFQAALKALIYLLRAGSVVDQLDASVVFSVAPAWANTAFAYAQASAGTDAYTTTNGAYADITFNGDAITVMMFQFADGPGGVLGGANAGTWQIKQGATVLAAGSQSAGATISATTGLGTAPVAVPLSGFGAGSHTIRFINTDNTGALTFLDGYSIPSATPPTVVVMKGVPIVGGAYPSYSDGAMAALNALIDTVVAGFPADGSVIVCDPSPGWNKATMLQADGIHPNDRGHAQIATNLDNTLLAKAGFRLGMNVGV